jgi:glycosyltransferase involved in cell wall biosynthesis
MKLLFLNVSGSLGGAERVLLDLLTALTRTEPRPRLHLLLAADGPLAEAAGRLGAHVDQLPLPDVLQQLGDSGLRSTGRLRLLGGLLARGPTALGAAWAYAGRLRSSVCRLRPQVVHSNNLKLHFLSILARLPVPVVWHLHDFLQSRRIMARALRLAGLGCRGAIAVSRAVADDARPVLGRCPMAVIPNAVDCERFAPGPGNGARLDALAGLPPGPAGVVRVGLVATYARWKGQDIFLEAARLLSRELASGALRFYIIGGPIYRTAGSQWSRAELRARAEDLLAEERLGFIDFQEDTPAIYRSLDVVVHASTQPEPFGLTIVEAMACSRAVVVSRAGGAAELFTPGHDALAAAPGDARALAEALRLLAADPDQRRRLGENARRTVLERFRRDRLGPELLAAYRSFGIDLNTAAQKWGSV